MHLRSEWTQDKLHLFELLQQILKLFKLVELNVLKRDSFVCVSYTVNENLGEYLLQVL